MDYNSKFTGPQVDDLLRKSGESAIKIVDLETEVDEQGNVLSFADKSVFAEYVRYSDGASIGTGGYFYEYIYNAEGVKEVEAFLYCGDTIPAAIAFYNTDTVTTEGYMGSYSVQHKDVTNSGEWYKAVVPKGAKIIVFSTRTDAETYAPVIKITISDLMVKIKKEVESVKTDIDKQSNVISLADNAVFAQFVRYSDGTSIATGAYFYEYVFKADNVKEVEAFLYCGDTIPAAIAFYNTDVVAPESYMGSYSVQHTDTSNSGAWYKASVPDGAKIIVFTTRTDAATYAPVIKIPMSNLMSETKKDVENMKHINVDLTNGVYGWIKNSTGEFYVSDATLTYVFSAKGVKNIRTFLKSDTPTINAVSFYKGKNISPESYISTSIPWLWDMPNGAWYDVNIPAEAEIFCITSNIRDGFVPQLLIPFEQYNAWQDYRLDELEKTNKSEALKGEIILNGLGDIYHYGMTAIIYREVVNEIPSQSIYDIRHAKELGYKCIEANLHRTLDGKYVVTHGLDGALGHDFSDINGNDAAGVPISSTTFEALRDNYRYYTPIKEYQVPVTSLEEFCGEAKACGLKVMLQYVDVASMDIARAILGDGNLFMYNAPRAVYDGVILEYLYFDDKESIVEHCKSMGAPYIYSMDNPFKFTDEQLTDICAALHKIGCYIASAYVTTEGAQRLRKLGFDLFAIDGTAKEIKSNQTMLKGRIISFNDDGSVTWEKY